MGTFHLTSRLYGFEKFLSFQFKFLSIQKSHMLSIYISMKEGSLFCFVVMRSAEPGCFRSCSSCLWKPLNKKGCMGLVPWHLDLQCKKVLQYWMISSLGIRLNSSWKFRSNRNVPLMLLERSWWAGFNGIYLLRFDSKWGRYWFLSDFCHENSNKFEKPGFGRKNQLRTW